MRRGTVCADPHLLRPEELRARRMGEFIPSLILHWAFQCLRSHWWQQPRRHTVGNCAVQRCWSRCDLPAGLRSPFPVVTQLL